MGRMLINIHNKPGEDVVHVIDIHAWIHAG